MGLLARQPPELRYPLEGRGERLPFRLGEDPDGG